MKSFAFAAALIAAVNAVELEWSKPVPVARVSYHPVTKTVQPAKVANAASKAYDQGYEASTGSDWDAWGRDQDLSIDESYGKTTAKSYRAESYDEWDNQDNDKWGAQAWGKDRDMAGASSFERDASKNKGKASWAGAQAQQGYDNDEWAKQAYGTDSDSRWGKSYDSVDAKNYANEHYAREVMADDDQWAEDYDRYNQGQKDMYGKAASKNSASSYGGWGKATPGPAAASYNKGAEYGGKQSSDWDAWGRDQDLHEKVSYDQTWAKSYSAESYDEWDNADQDKWGAQAWGKDRDVMGASSYGAAASAKKTTAKTQPINAYYGGSYGKAYGAKAAHGVAGHGAAGYGNAHGKGYAGYAGAAYGGKAAYGGAHGAYGGVAKVGEVTDKTVWQGASKNGAAQKAGYDNDEWAKQANGSDFDSRWGKSYDRVSAKSYDNEKYARWLQADDDQWAEDYDRYDSGDMGAYGKAASYKGPGKTHGWGKGPAGKVNQASAAGQDGYWGKSGSDWDAYGRDQDLEIDESYESTWAKSYDAESYDEWDNKDDDMWGAQQWGKDRDLYGASSYNKAASEKDTQSRTVTGYAGLGYGHGYGGYGGYGKHAKAQTYSTVDQGASAAKAAAAGSYDNDEWAKQAYGRDADSRWGKSYDMVNAASYDDQQYARKVRADDDQWAEDYDRYTENDYDRKAAAASVTKKTPAVKKTTYVPTVDYGYAGYGNGGYGGYGYGGYGNGW